MKEPQPDPQDPGDALRTPLQLMRSAVELILGGEAGPIGAEALALLAEIGRAIDALEIAVERVLADQPAASR